MDSSQSHGTTQHSIPEHRIQQSQSSNSQDPSQTQLHHNQNQQIPLDEITQNYFHTIQSEYSNEDDHHNTMGLISRREELDSRAVSLDNWMREPTTNLDGDKRDAFDQIIDNLIRPDDVLNISLNTSGTNTSDSSSNAEKSPDLENQGLEVCKSNQDFNENIDMLENYKGNTLNDTYSLNQDNGSDYSLGLRRSNSGLTIHGESAPQKPKLRDIEDPIERENLFRRYIDECCKIYDFREECSFDDLDLRENKVSILSEISEILVEDPELLAPFESLYDEIFRMFTTNIFRSLPATPTANQNLPEFDPEEDELYLEASWPHLELVYDVLLGFTSSPLFELDRAKRHINEKFVLKLLLLFQSRDPRERSYLISLLHRIYGQFLGLRAHIRKQIGNIFSTFIYENEYHNGIADLLELLSCIIRGFVQPLREEHKVFLLKILMPLHKARTLSTYHVRLSICIVQYIEKDHTLTEPIVNSLLRFWPKVNSTKEVIFLNEIEEILDIIEPSEFQKIMIALFRQLARCIQSTQFQAAERVLYFWNNEYILSLINDNIQTILPIVLPALHVEPQTYWNKTIHGLIYNALKLSTQMNQKLFHDLVQEQDSHKKRNALTLEDKAKKWRRVQEMAEENAQKINFS